MCKHEPQWHSYLKRLIPNVTPGVHFGSRLTEVDRLIVMFAQPTFKITNVITSSRVAAAGLTIVSQFLPVNGFLEHIEGPSDFCAGKSILEGLST